MIKEISTKQTAEDFASIIVSKFKSKEINFEEKTITKSKQPRHPGVYVKYKSTDNIFTTLLNKEYDSRCIVDIAKELGKAVSDITCSDMGGIQFNKPGIDADSEGPSYGSIMLFFTPKNSGYSEVKKPYECCYFSVTVWIFRGKVKTDLSVFCKDHYIAKLNGISFEEYQKNSTKELNK